MARKRDKNSKYNQREARDRQDFDLILSAYKARGYDKGRRGIHMRLLHMGIVMNEKKISRLMNKYNLRCPIRGANPYKKMLKASTVNSKVSNVLNREFEKHGPRHVLLTDVTYLYYSKKVAYLSVIKDAFTKEILSYVLSETQTIDLALETVLQMYNKHSKELKAKTLLHSDQGCLYTSYAYKGLLEKLQLKQSMSRRGNCWDNAPQESFFGHMKDEIKISECKTFEQLKLRIDDYMDYYNNERYQYQLAKLSPTEFYNYCITGKYPLLNATTNTNIEILISEN